MRNAPPLWLSWAMWGLVMGLYFIGFFQRMAPAVMAEDLMRDFKLGGALLGNLSAMYFYSYALMQIPSGLLADRLGSRRLAGGACAVAACGIILFSVGTSIWFAYAGRLLIGASVAVAWVTCMKLAGHWFPPNRFATVTGVGLVVGNLGGVLAGVPLSEAVSLFGWRLSMAASGLLTFAVALAIWLAVRDDPQEYGYRSFAHSSVLKNGNLPAGAALRSVILNRQTWLLFFAGGLTAAPVLTFAGLWGVPYLTQVHQLDRTAAATITSTMLIAWAVGGPVLGGISDRLGRRKLPYLLSSFFAALFWGVFLFAELPYLLLYPLVALIGFSSAGLIIGFAFAREVNHPGATGAVGGFVNMSVLGIAAIMQPVLGSILDRGWDGAMVNGARVYSEAAYLSAFSWLLVSTILAVVMVQFTTESFCRIRED